MNSDQFIGVLWIVLTTICFSLTLTVVRYIGTDMPATQAAFIRYFFWRDHAGTSLDNCYATIINGQKKPNIRSGKDEK